MSEPFLGQISAFSFNFPPKGWALCNGQLLPINQNQALFSLLGTTYGGDGRVNFALPNLQGRIPLHFGQSPVGSPYTLGQVGGEAAHTLISAELPAHTHVPVGSSSNATAASPAGAYSAVTAGGSYSASHTTTLAPQAVGNAGGSQSHDNRSPYLVLNFCIALAGIFPSRN
jgi:microcystin-dependent protein